MLYCFKLIIADDIAIWKRNLGLIGLYNFHLHCIGALELVGEFLGRPYFYQINVLEMVIWTYVVQLM